MAIKADTWIREQAEKGMIEPFSPNQVREVVDRQSMTKRRLISYGVSSLGCDIRLAGDFKLFTNVHSAVIDPKNMTDDVFVNLQAEDFILAPPHSFILGRSVERFKIPPDVLGLVLGKSTYCRCGLVVNTSPMEPGWEGYLTIELSNTTPLPMKIYVGEGIAQVLFFQSDQVPEVSYATRNGKYNHQGPEVVLPKV